MSLSYICGPKGGFYFYLGSQIVFSLCMDVSISFVKKQGCANQHLVLFGQLMTDNLINLQ